MTASEPTLEQRLVELIDQDGSFSTLVEGMRALTANPVTRQIVQLAGTNPADLDALLARHDDMLAVTAEGIRQFAALGWAPCGQMPTTGLRDALAVLADTGDIEAAEEVLADAYNDGVLSGASSINRVQTLGYPSEEYREVFRRRGQEFLFTAWERHQSKDYAASVPLIYAQVEGIAFDVANKPFFSRRDGVDPIDTQTLAGMNESLAVTREWFVQSVNITGATGSGSRHGVLHGRELAYNTRIVSTKALVLLLAVIEWARPIAEELGEWFEAERMAHWLDSTETDADGRRHDRREFKETTKSLRWLATCQGGWYMNRGGRFQPGHLEVVHDAFVRNGLPESHGTVMRVSDDGQSWYAWRRTVTGYVFGIGANAHAHCLPHGLPTDWRWEGDDPPTGPPGEDPVWGEDPFSGVWLKNW